MSDSNRDIVLAELEKYGGQQKSTGNGWIMVVCPFHDDSNPSCGVRVAGENIGFFNCFSCDEGRGPWNKFAEKTGLRTINEWNKTQSLDDSLISEELEDSLLGDTGITFKQVMKRMHHPEAMPWPSNMEWRGFPGWLLNKVGAHIVNDKHNDSVAVLFPVKISGKVRGGVKAIYEKKHKKQLSYINMKGAWVQKYGLFPFMYAKKLIEKQKLRFIVVVEGPRDALRLCLNNIPAVCVLGAKNVTKTKMLFIESLELDAIYVMPDNDEGGEVFWKNVKANCTNKPKKISLPKDVDECGNLIKMDPGEMPKKVLKRLVRMLEEKHDFIPPEELK